MSNEHREFSFTTQRRSLGEDSIPLGDDTSPAEAIGISTSKNAVFEDDIVEPDYSPTPTSVIKPESGDMTHFSGDTGQMAVLDTTQDSAINDGPFGDLALMENGNGDNMRNGAYIISLSGLGNYPVAGDTFSWIQAEPDYSNDNGFIQTFFGVQDSNNWYSAGLDPNDSFGLEKDGVAQVTTSPSIDPGVWYGIEIQWGTGGTITGTIYEIDQNDGSRLSELDSIQFTDSEYTGGGVGVGGKGATGGGYAMQQFVIAN